MPWCCSNSHFGFVVDFRGFLLLRGLGVVGKRCQGGRGGGLVKASVSSSSCQVANIRYSVMVASRLKNRRLELAFAFHMSRPDRRQYGKRRPAN